MNAVEGWILPMYAFPVSMPSFVMFSSVIFGHPSSDLIRYVSLESIHIVHEGGPTPYPQSPDWETIKKFNGLTKLSKNLFLTIFIVPKRYHKFVGQLSDRFWLEFRPILRSNPLTSAYWVIPKPIFWGPSENPKLGKLNATTWKLGSSDDPFTRSGNIFRTSIKLPGPVKIVI